MSVLRTKSVEQSIADTDEPDHRLKKNLHALDLIVFGVGVIIGAGIFVLTGTVAASNAGPAIAISFVIAGVACALAALCYAEFASTVPVAGSAYTFSYATFGELVAWIIGWDLVLEFTIGSSALAVGFSGYLVELLDGTALAIPESMQSAQDGVVNLPAVIISLLVMTVLILGIKLSSRIDTPRPLSNISAGRTVIGGVAWAQHHGVAKVDVRIDGGRWQPADLGPDAGIDYWRQWFLPWDAEPGSHQLAVRVTDRDGTVQSDDRATPFPDGSSGIQEIVVTVA